MLAPPASTTQDQVTESGDSEPMMIEEEIETKLEDLGCEDILKKLTKSAVNFMETDPSRKAVYVGPIIKQLQELRTFFCPHTPEVENLVVRVDQALAALPKTSGKLVSTKATEQASVMLMKGVEMVKTVAKPKGPSPTISEVTGRAGQRSGKPNQNEM